MLLKNQLTKKQDLISFLTISLFSLPFNNYEGSMITTDLKEFKNYLPAKHSLLGFDYGEKRLGIAISDLLLMTANPLKIIYRKTIEQDIAAIGNIISEREIGGFVCGLPLQMDGLEGKTAQAVRLFATKIDQTFKLPFLLWDERLSSKAVESFLIKEVDLSRAKRKQILDSQAAGYILQGVLDALRYL